MAFNSSSKFNLNRIKTLISAEIKRYLVNEPLPVTCPKRSEQLTESEASTGNCEF